MFVRKVKAEVVERRHCTMKRSQAKPALDRLVEMCVVGPRFVESEAAEDSITLPLTKSGASVSF